MPQNIACDKWTLIQVMIGAVWWQSITWANVDSDLCLHMASQGHSVLIGLFGYQQFEALQVLMKQSVT